MDTCQRLVDIIRIVMPKGRSHRHSWCSPESSTACGCCLKTKVDRLRKKSLLFLFPMMTRASYLLGQCCTTEPHSQALYNLLLVLNSGYSFNSQLEKKITS